MNNLPAQVQKMADKADELIQKVNNPTVEPSREGKADELPKKEAVKEPEHQITEPVKQDPGEENWKHKYQVLQGKYNTEIKAIKDDVNLLTSLKSQVRTLTQQVQEGGALIRSLEEKLKEKEATAPVPAKVEVPESVLTLLTDEERIHFEEEGIDTKSLEIFGKLIRNLSSKTQNPQSSVDLEEIKREVGDLKSNAKTNRVNTFWDEINKNVSDWEEINQSKEFNDWLDEVIPYTTITKRDAIRTAQEQLNYSKAIELFKDFKKHQANKLPDPEPEPLLDPEKHIEPNNSAVPVIQEPPAGKTYTLAEVKQFYADVAKGKIPADKATKMDADILKANQEGRIRG